MAETTVTAVHDQAPHHPAWEWTGAASALGGLAACFGFLALIAVGATDGPMLIAGMALVALMAMLALANLTVAPLVALAYAVDRCSPAAVAWWCVGAAVSLAMSALMFPVALWGVAVALLGVIGFGGRASGSRLVDDPSVAAVPEAWRWVRAQVREQDALPGSWRWRIALGRAPWWFGLLGAVVAIGAAVAITAMFSAIPAAGMGSTLGAIALSTFGTLAAVIVSAPLVAAIGVAVPVFAAALLMLTGTQWLTDGVVLHGSGASRGLRLRARLVHTGFDLAMWATLFSPGLLADGSHRGIAHYSPWLLLPPLLVGRVVYVSVVAAGQRGSTSALRQTARIMVQRPFDVARMLVVQAGSALGIAFVAVPLFVVAAVVASPTALLALVPHGLGLLAGASFGTHAWLFAAEALLYCLLCAVLAGRVVAPLLLWHTRHRVLFVRRLLDQGPAGVIASRGTPIANR